MVICFRKNDANGTIDRSKVCGAWSFTYDDANSESGQCKLFHRNTCCSQRLITQTNKDAVMGFVCPTCWGSHGSCPCDDDILTRPTNLDDTFKHCSGCETPKDHNPTVSWLLENVIGSLMIDPLPFCRPSSQLLQPSPTALGAGHWSHPRVRKILTCLPPIRESPKPAHNLKSFRLPIWLVANGAKTPSYISQWEILAMFGSLKV